jgi:hypothetical protein
MDEVIETTKHYFVQGQEAGATIRSAVGDEILRLLSQGYYVHCAADGTIIATKE